MAPQSVPAAEGVSPRLRRCSRIGLDRPRATAESAQPTEGVVGSLASGCVSLADVATVTHGRSYLICGPPRTGSTLLCRLLQSTGVAGVPESYFRLPDEQLWAGRWQLARDLDGSFDYGGYLRAAIAAGRTSNGVFGARVMWGTMDKVAVPPGVEPWFDADAIGHCVRTINEHNTAWQDWFAAFDVRPHTLALRGADRRHGRRHPRRSEVPRARHPGRTDDNAQRSPSG